MKDSANESAPCQYVYIISEKCSFVNRIYSLYSEATPAGGSESSPEGCLLHKKYSTLLAFYTIICYNKT